MIVNNSSMSVFENRITFIEPVTLLDFPNNIAAIFFYNYCNIRCPYCYNKNVVEGKMPIISADYIKQFLKRRKNKIDGIVFSGGECTIHGEKLYEDIQYVKDMGFKTKLDTNGTNPNLIKKLIENNVIDYIALDYKCPMKKRDLFFPRIHFYDLFEETLEYLCKTDVPFEVRTTVHTDIIDENDINEIAVHLIELGYKNTYYLQNYFDVEETLGNVSHNPRPLDFSKLSTDIKIEIRNENNG